MVSAKTVVARFKAAWSSAGDDEYVTVDSPKGKWVVRVKMQTQEHDVHRFYVAIEVPAGVDGGAKKLKAPGTYRTKPEAKKEADIWVKDLKKNGTVKLTGWKPDN